MNKSKQTSFLTSKTNHQFSHGGELRSKRAGRGQRPLSTKEPLHVVFKVNKSTLKLKTLRGPKEFRCLHQILKKYAQRFLVKIEQISVQNDHIHLLIRTSRRSQFHHFFRVCSGQISQQFRRLGFLKFKYVTDTHKTHNSHSTANKLNFWKHRPFSRVIRGFKAYKVVKNYIQLNEKEAMGLIPYRKTRLKGLSLAEWSILWGRI